MTTRNQRGRAWADWQRHVQNCANGRDGKCFCETGKMLENTFLHAIFVPS